MNSSEKNRISEYLCEALEYIKLNFCAEDCLDKEKPSNLTSENIEEALERCLYDADLSDAFYEESEPSIVPSSHKRKIFSKGLSGKTSSQGAEKAKCSHPCEDEFPDIPLETEESFREAVLGFIRTKGMKESEVYKRAGLDRRLFSKIMCERDYQPSKDTAIALSIGFELTTEEAGDLLEKAGYILSRSSRRDLVILYFLEKRIYVLTDINQVLYSLGEKIIGRF